MFANAWSSFAVGETKLWDKTLSLTHDSLWNCEQVNIKYTREYLNTKNSVKTEKSKNLSSQSWRDSCYCNNILLTHIACGQSLHTPIPPFLKKQSTQDQIPNPHTEQGRWMDKCMTGHKCQGLRIKDAGPCNSWCWFYCLITSLGQTAVDQDNINSADRTEQPLMWCCA